MRRSSIRFGIFALVCLGCAAAHAATVFRDDFSGSQLDANEWGINGGTYLFNRAYFGLTPTVSGGAAHFRFDTYNPDHAGTHFLGTFAYIYQEFTRGAGLELEARVRTNEMPSGMVTSFFTWAENPNGTSDEIDFEFLTSQINDNPVPPGSGQPVVMTTWNNWEGNPSHYDDGIHQSSQTETVPGLDLTEFNTFTIRWLPDRTEWLVNGQVVHATSQALADAPTHVFINFWAPDENWAEAYSAALQPAGSAAANQSFFYDVDYVEVRTIPEPTSLALAAIGLLAALAWIRRAQITAPGFAGGSRQHSLK